MPQRSDEQTVLDFRPRRAAVGLWVEPFGGSCALALSLHAGTRPPFTYQGGKARNARATLEVFGLKPGDGAERYVLNDAGVSVDTYRVLCSPEQAERVASMVEQMDEGEAGWLAVRDRGVPADDVERAAAWCALQASVVLGKPVVEDGTRWRTAGYARVSPSGIARGFRERHNPAALAAKVRRVAPVLASMRADWTRGLAAEMLPPPATRASWCYIDPPYRGTTGYASGSARDEVVAIALRFLDAGYSVAIAEGEPIEIAGGQVVELTASEDRRSLPSARREYLTVVRAA